MATNDIGVRVKLEGERQYNEQMRQITQQTKLMRAETLSLEQSWGKGTSAMQKATQQTELLKKQIDTQKASVATAKANVERYSKATGENSTQTLKWKATLKEAENELKRLEMELANVPNKLQIMGQNMQQVGAMIQSVGKKMTSVGTTLTKYVTVPIVGLAAAAVKTTADFDKSMSKVAAVSGATGKDFEALRSKAREMGATTKFSATEAAEAFNYMAMAGWKTEDMLEGVEGIMNLAAASGEDLATTSDIVTDALTAFGKSASDSGRLADIMAAASANANTNVAMMGETFKYAAPVAGALGFTMEDTAIAVGLMANAGIKSSQAGTALRTGLTNLVKPTKQMQDAMEKYGIEITNADGSMKSMREIVEMLRDKLGGLDEAEQAAAAGAIFGKNAMSGWLAIINASDEDVEKLTQAIDNSDGTAKKMAETMQDNLAGQLTILKSQLQELAISFGDILVPKIRKAVEWVQKQVDAFNDLDPKTKEQIVKFGLLAAAIGPVLVVGGKFVTAVGGIVSTVGKAVEAYGTFSAAHAGLAAALGPVTVAIGLAAGAAIALKQGYDYIEESARKANPELYATVDAVEESTGKMSEAGDELKGSMEDAEKSIFAVNEQAKKAEDAVETIEELGKKGNLTAGEMKILKGAVQTLKNIYPDLDIEIDETTGSLNMSTDAIKDFIDESTKMAKVQAYQEAVKNISEKIANAYVEQATAAYNLDKAQEELSSAQEELNTQMEAAKRHADNMSEADRELYALGTEMTAGWNNQSKAVGDAQKAVDDCQTAYDELNVTIAESEEEQQYYQDQLVELEKELGLESDALDESTTSAENASEAISGLGDDTDEAAEDICDAMDEISKTYSDTYNSAKDSILGQSSLWDELEEDEKTSVAKMRKNLDDHIKAYRSWNSNATTLMSSTEYQTDASFRAMVDSIITAGIDMAPELQAIVDAYESGDSELAELTADYGDMSELAGYMASTTAAATLSLQYGITDMKTALINSGVPEEVFNVMDKAKNLIGGISFKSVAEKAVKTISEAQPEAETQGTGLIEAVETGVENETSNLEDDMYDAGSNGASQLATGMSDKQEDVETAAANIATAAAGMGDIGDSYAWGKHVAENLIEGMKAKLEAVKEMAKSLATAIALNLKHSTPEEGPLKNDDVWGLHLGQNFARGMEQSIPLVEAASMDLAQAVSLPTGEYYDIGMNQAEAVTGADITDAFIAAAEQIDWRVVISNREFGRILRDQGVA